MSEVELYLGDCLVEMSRIKDSSVDMVLTDLPFGTTSNSWDSVIPMAELWQQFKRVAKPHGAIVLFGVQPFTSLLVTSHLDGYKHRWVWNKRQPGNFAVAKFMPMSIDEDIVVFTPKGERVNYYPIMSTGKRRLIGGRHSEKHGRGFGGLAQVCYESDQFYPKSILEFSVVVRQGNLHPSQKPTDLLSYLINTYTQSGETVLDCTMGSGSCGVACMETGRRFIGVERDETYFNIATKRIADASRAAAGQPKQLTGHASDLDGAPLFSMTEV